MTESKPKGWTSWHSAAMPEDRISRVWPDARPLHFLKENRTVFYDGSQLVAEIRWRTIAHFFCMKKPPAGWKPREIDYDRVLQTMAAWRSA